MVASIRMAAPTWTVARTMTTGMTLGTRWRRMMRMLEAPMVRAASTYWFWALEMAAPRMTRMELTPRSEPTMRMIQNMVSYAEARLAKTVSAKMRRMMAGMASTISTMRCTMVSNQPE